jgi:hypothetical protein
VNTYLNVVWLLHVFCMWLPHAKDMQIAMNFQQKFGAFRSSFNTWFSEFTEGWTNPNICVYNFNFQPLQQPPQHTTRQSSGKLLVLCVFFVSIETENDLVFLRCFKTSIQSFPLNTILKDSFPFMVFGRDYGHYPAQFEDNITAIFFPLYPKP